MSESKPPSLFRLPSFVFFDPERRSKGYQEHVELPDGTEIIRVPLSRGLFAVLDVPDWDRVCPMYEAWYANVDGAGLPYARSRLRGSADTRLQVTLHRAIMEAGPGDRVSFLDGNTLDCRRANLVLTPPYQDWTLIDGPTRPQEGRW